MLVSGATPVYTRAGPAPPHSSEGAGSAGARERAPREVEEYAFLGIPEYWIVDYRGLGGVAFIGKPKRPTFTVCQLVNGEYINTKYYQNKLIQSDLFPDIQLCLNDLVK